MCMFVALHLQCVKIELAKSSLRKESALKIVTNSFPKNTLQAASIHTL